MAKKIQKNKSYSNKEVYNIEQSAKKNKSVAYIRNKKDLNPIEIIKLSICSHITKYMVKNKTNNKEMSSLIKTSIDKLSNVNKRNIENLSLDELFGYLTNLSEINSNTKKYIKTISTYF